MAVVKGPSSPSFPRRASDISHGIMPLDNAQAAFVLRNAYPPFRGERCPMVWNPK